MPFTPRAGLPRCAVVDLGSNSVRLVVYEGLGRNPMSIFNEKAVLRLGRGLQATGLLDPDGMAQAMTILHRYRAVAQAMGAHPIEILATAAVRDARNGSDFVRQIQARMPDVPVRILSGVEEAELSSDGLLCGIPEADGLLADIGGGSLELVRLDDGRRGTALTLPLGVIRLSEQSGGDPAERAADRRRGLPLDRLAERNRRPRSCIWSAAHGVRSRGSIWRAPITACAWCIITPSVGMRRANCARAFSAHPTGNWRRWRASRAAGWRICRSPPSCCGVWCA